jgi:hypothetical protein
MDLNEATTAPGPARHVAPDFDDAPTIPRLGLVPDPDLDPDEWAHAPTRVLDDTRDLTPPGRRA